MNEDEFKAVIKNYIEQNKIVKAKTKEIQVLKKNKLELENSIKEYMIQQEIPQVNVGITSITLSTKKKSKPVNKDFLIEKLSEKLQDSIKSVELIEYVFSNKDYEDVQVLQTKN